MMAGDINPYEVVKIYEKLCRNTKNSSDFFLSANSSKKEAIKKNCLKFTSISKNSFSQSFEIIFVMTGVKLVGRNSNSVLQNLCKTLISKLMRVTNLGVK